MMETLAERVEAADGPDRKLDVAVAKSIGFFAGTRASYEFQQHMIPTPPEQPA